MTAERRRRPLQWTAAALTISFLAFGCGSVIRPKLARMTEVSSAAPPAATRDAATVVFLRPWPGEIGDAVAEVAVLDEDGTWLGDAAAESHFVVRVPPGDHMFIAWSTNTAALKATLSVGQVYYVEMFGKVGLIPYAPVVAMEALTPHHEDWKYLHDWLHDTRRIEPLPTGKPYYEGRAQDAAARVQSAKENWDGYNAAEKMRRTLRAEDGTRDPQ
jgi:hypothetical protein